ncbi:MAG: T9SS type A sorting domain-containing protein [Candidatus Delongbacteria bacterium]|nr:T9SS type A sorting domain-containing protein [Candidatus Delongbacteria bacterium]MBN2833777.1 T9SS type A sorting domain-containing protein [Candidatus Delongbacteria bacterium]
MRTMIILLVLLLNLYAEKSVVRISSNSISQKDKAFLLKNYDILSVSVNGDIEIAANENDLLSLESGGFDPMIVKSEKDIRESLFADGKPVGYRNYDALLQELQELEANNPGLVKLEDIGDSWGKIYSSQGLTNYDQYSHDIWALKLSDNVDSDEDEPEIFYFAEHHAREPISLEVNMNILNHLISSYGVDQELTDLVNSTEIWFVPLVNPDGHKIVMDDDNLWWRKNGRDNNENHNLDTGDYSDDGVDLNRNYGFAWGDVGSSNSFNDDTYHGPYEFSEPETQAIRDFIDSHNFISGITYHSYSELVLYPFGYSSSALAPDNNALQELAIDMAESIPSQGGGHYTPQKSSALYPTMGSTDDWAYGTHGIFVYTIELATEFIPPSNQVNGICQDNLEAALIMLRRVHRQLVTGKIVNGSGSPIEAEIYVDGVDNTGEFRHPIKSELDFGRYTRLLTEGSYDITFKAYGYLNQTIEDVEVSQNDITALNVTLQEADFYSVSGVVSSYMGVLSGAILQFSGIPVDPIVTNTNGEFIFPSIAEGVYTLRAMYPGFTSQSMTIEISGENYTGIEFLLLQFNGDDFESGIISDPWILSGSADWFASDELPANGEYCAESGDIDDGASSSLLLVHSVGSGQMSFDYKVSSESGYDYLYFKVDGVTLDSWSGNVSWSNFTCDLEAGEHTFEWVYSKDGYLSSGSDCAWVDNVLFPYFINIDENHVKSFEIIGNYPNPFNPMTTVNFVSDIVGKYDFALYNSNGEIVSRYNINAKTGFNSFKIDCSTYNSGVYFLKSGNNTLKMMLLK